MVIKVLLIIWMALIIVASFFYSGAAAGFPGQTSRIMFFHVPQAIIATISFLVSMIGSVLYLSKRRINADHLALSAAEIGLLLSILATITGSIFAKPTWNSYWHWDPRETSIVILLMIYGAYFALRSAIPDPEKKRVFAGVYSILAFVTVPFLVFILPRITVSLHPEDTLNPANPGMDVKTMRVFLGSLLAYSGLYLWMLRLKMRILMAEDSLVPFNDEDEGDEL